MKSDKKWETYEQVANDLLNRFAAEFDLELVEGKQKILGLRSGTEWEIEGKGVAINEEKFIIIECRRYTTSRLNQESMGGLAYRIMDTGASGGIIVTPIGLQDGASKIASIENIVTVILDKDSSSTDYVMAFLDQITIGIGGEVTLKGDLSIRVIRKDGSIEERGTV